ncbi:MAG: M23 family metallopeptidase [Ruminococcaceae bacterium]|nr:M23 family metallopeptidase [Oscillospiraceae bacterium]
MESFIIYVGESVGKAFSAVVSFIITLFKTLIAGIKWVALFIYDKVDQFVVPHINSFIEEWSFFRGEVRQVKDGIKESIKKNPLSLFPILRHYSKVAYKKHTYMFSNLTNTVLPIVGLVILAVTINYWGTKTFALEVVSGGQSVGYVENEAVFLDAQSRVKERFSADVAGEEAIRLDTKYTVVTVQPNELTDSATLSDNIVEKTGGESTFACGVYIDGDFICALKNETDAMQVFNNILDENAVEDENAVVGFVEDVQYVQGLYADNEETIWDSEKLTEKLKTTKSEAKYYTVQMGDTVSQIANANGLRTSELYALNPGLKEMIKIGDRILVSHEVNYIRIKVVKTEIKREEIAFKIVKENNSKLYKGTTKIKRRGSKGIDEVTYLVTYIDGARVSSEEINRITIRQPIDQLVDVGTKKAAHGPYTGHTYIRGKGSLIWPAVGCNTVSSRYGYRTLRGRRNFHGGIDLTGGYSRGKTVVAAASGTVTTAGWGGAYGYYVIINHGNGMSTLYAHMLANSICVKPGQYVSGGAAIGKVGSTGNTTGAHLHFEVRINGSRVNPAPYLGV